MNELAQVLFWSALAILVFTYLGYLFLLIFLNLFRSKRKGRSVSSIPVTVIIPAFNERQVLAAKINNTRLGLKNLTGSQIILITDGSDDGSETLFQNETGIIHLHQPQRQGKSAAINRAMLSVTTPIVIFTDANTMVNETGFEKILEQYQNPEVGGVSGEKRVVTEEAGGSVGGEGLYWKYESFLKQQSSKLYTVVGAAGELFSMRTDLFDPLRPDTILDDFVLSVRILQKGFRVTYEPMAFAMEKPSQSIADEFGRKVRISSGAWQTMPRVPFLFNPFKRPVVFFQFISHRFLRWTLAPISLPVLYLSNAFLLENYWFLCFFIAQSAFYFLALAGFLFRNKKVPTLVFIPFYFCMMNFAVLAGFFSYLRGNHSVLWKKAAR